MSKSTARRVAIYVRLSATTEESVSIDRQTEACRKYAEARGWEVVLTAVDDGVSATKKRPEDRDGWCEVISAVGAFDVVLVWKVDRLARNVLDFLNADKQLQEHGAGIAAVEDPVDMTTPQGRAFAVMLSVFAELEAATIRTRVTAARKYLTENGRVTGGDLPWFLRKVANEGGAGYHAEPVPERAEAIRDAVERVLEGETLLSVCRRWTEAGFAPPGKGARARESWSISSLKGLLMNPGLYGATRYRGDVLRNADRTPKIDPARVIVDRETFFHLQGFLDGRRRGERPIDKPLLLQHVASCASCGEYMRAHRRDGRHDYTCLNRDCAAQVSVRVDRLDEYVSEVFLSRFGRFEVTRVESIGGQVDGAALGLLQADLDDVRGALEDDDLAEETASLLRTRRKDLRAAIDDLRASAQEETRVVATGETFAEAFGRASISERRSILADAFGRVVVGRARARGRYATPIAERVAFVGRDVVEAEAA